MKNKMIIGFMGDSTSCQKASEILNSFGFYRVSIQNKVREIAKYLMHLENEEINNDIIEKIRNRGYLVNRLYWINLVLSSVPEGTEKVVVEDLRIEDIVGKIISPYFISLDGEEKDCPQDMELFVRDKNPDNFIEDLKKKFKKR